MGPAFWLVLIPIVAGFAAIVLLLREGVRVERTLYLETRRFVCPRLDREVVATVIRSRPSGEVVGVQSCTGLPDPDQEACGEECVAGLNEKR